MGRIKYDHKIYASVHFNKETFRFTISKCEKKGYVCCTLILPVKHNYILDKVEIMVDGQVVSVCLFDYPPYEYDDKCNIRIEGSISGPVARVVEMP